MKKIITLTLFIVFVRIHLYSQVIDGGAYYSILLCDDSTVWITGDNFWGESGDSSLSTGTFILSPIQVPNFSQIKYVAAGFYHCMAIKDNGTVWTWGKNDFGQLGNGTTSGNNPNATPTQVPGLTNIIAIEGGELLTMALRNDGTVWAWGKNHFGQLGNGTTSDTSLPVQVTGLSNIIAIEAGDYHSMALENNGTVWAWGWNQMGQLGNGTSNGNTPNPLPSQVAGLTNIIAIDAGSGHSIALRNDGTVWTWGYNEHGELGNDTTTFGYTPNPFPVQVKDSSGVGFLNNIVSIFAEGDHCMAIKNDSTLWTWGLNNVGQLGNGTYNSDSLPLIVSSLSGVTSIAAGPYHSIALLSNGTVWAWGNNGTGRLGDGTDEESLVPVQMLLSCTVTAPTVGIIVPVNSARLNFYPNPFLRSVSIAIHKKNSKQVTFEIKNILGQTVYIKQENNLNDTYTKTIELSFLSKGIYLLDVIIDGERTVKKIVKE